MRFPFNLLFDLLGGAGVPNLKLTLQDLLPNRREQARGGNRGVWVAFRSAISRSEENRLVSQGVYRSSPLSVAWGHRAYGAG